jgi:hypothetical protein
MVDFTEILAELSRAKIKFAVVGGIAVNLHGIPRMTYDFDLLLELEDGNLKKYIKVMKKLGYKSKRPVKLEDLAVKKKRDEWIKEKNRTAFKLYNGNASVREVDVVIDSPVSYEKAEKNFVFVELCGLSIPVAGLKDLIKMKQSAGRLQDASDIRYLRKKNQ